LGQGGQFFNINNWSSLGRSSRDVGWGGPMRVASSGPLFLLVGTPGGGTAEGLMTVFPLFHFPPLPRRRLAGRVKGQSGLRLGWRGGGRRCPHFQLQITRACPRRTPSSAGPIIQGFRCVRVVPAVDARGSMGGVDQRLPWTKKQIQN